MAKTHSSTLPFNVKDLRGKVFGQLEVVAYMGTVNGESRWLCVCQCGQGHLAFRGNLVSGQTKSCGCLRRSVAAKCHTTHGRRKTPEYKAWQSLIRRCYNQNDAGYHRYGGRGITVCDRWRKSFALFFEDMGPRPSASHSIERQNNNKGYCKENCCWATPPVQTRNRRSNVMITFDDRTMCLADWAIECNLRTDTLWRRLNRLDWSIERALTTPVHATSPRHRALKFPA